MVLDLANNIFILFCISGCCTFQRVKLLTIPLVFSVGLVAADIISDIATAQRLVSRGNIYWGLLTALLIIAPFFARLVLYLVSLSRCYKITWSDQKFFGIRKIQEIKKISARLTFWWQELNQIWWHIPVFLPLRCVYLCYTFNSNVQEYSQTCAQQPPLGPRKVAVVQSCFLFGGCSIKGTIDYSCAGLMPVIVDRWL